MSNTTSQDDLIREFIDYMSAHECEPTGQIIPDNEFHDFRIASDPAGKVKGYYSLRIDNDGFAVGCFGDRRVGENIGWTPKTKKAWTPEDKAAWKQRTEDAKRVQANQDAAIVANASWIAAKPATSHPYIDRKGIAPLVTRIDSDSNLLIPMYLDGKIVNVQSIDAEGNKLFLPGAKKSGTYCPLTAKTDDKSVILICEGFATGASLREATGYPVMVAFDAGNLPKVAKIAREKRPDARIIICADNDTETIVKGQPKNVGLIKGKEAAALVGGFCIWPEMPEDKAGDFNDAAVALGADYVNNRIQQVVPIPADVAGESVSDEVPMPPDDLQPLPGDGGAWIPVIYDEDNHIDWQAMAIWKNKRPGDSPELEERSLNYSLLVKYEKNIRGVFCWDEFNLCVMVVKCPPWTKESEFKVHKLEDLDIRNCDYWVQRKGLKGGMDKTHGAIEDAAHLNSFNPAREFFEALEWDGVKRLDGWLANYMGVVSDDPDYVSQIGAKWMMGAVARVYKPGCKFDHMLMFEGAQGAYKSTTLRALATFGDDEEKSYFTDQFKLGASDNKDELQKLSGCLIVEIGEMADFNKKDMNSMKAFITAQVDRFRPPYGRLPKDFPRQFVLSGTYNPIDGIFNDPTGGRRFWPVTVGTIDIEAIRKDRKQLWAEATARYKSGEKLYLEGAVAEAAKKAISERSIVDPWQSAIEDVIGARSVVTPEEILTQIGVSRHLQTRREVQRITHCLKFMRWEYKRVYVGGKQRWRWVRPEWEA